MNNKSFNFKAKKHSKAFPFDPIPWLDTLLICALLSLCTTPFINAPGLPMSLPNASKLTLNSIPTSAIVTLYNNDLFFFEGSVYHHDELQEAFFNHINTYNHQNHTLLIKMNKGTPIDGLFQICDVAKKAGFTQVQIASTPQTQADNPSISPQSFPKPSSSR